MVRPLRIVGSGDKILNQKTMGSSQRWLASSVTVNTDKLKLLREPVGGFNIM